MASPGQVRPGQARPGQFRSGKVMQSYLDLKIHTVYNIQRAIHKLPTQFHVNRAIEPRVITVDAQIASWHLIISLPAHRNRYLEKFWGVLHSSWNTPWRRFTHQLCPILFIFEESKVLKMHFLHILTVKGQRSFRILMTLSWLQAHFHDFMTQMVALLILFQ